MSLGKLSFSSCAALATRVSPSTRLARCIVTKLQSAKTQAQHKAPTAQRLKCFERRLWATTRSGRKKCVHTSKTATAHASTAVSHLQQPPNPLLFVNVLRAGQKVVQDLDDQYGQQLIDSGLGSKANNIIQDLDRK
eukprot:19465-Heterococcus_DN1.PRE.3